MSFLSDFLKQLRCSQRTQHMGVLQRNRWPLLPVRRKAEGVTVYLQSAGLEMRSLLWDCQLLGSEQRASNQAHWPFCQNHKIFIAAECIMRCRQCSHSFPISFSAEPCCTSPDVIGVWILTVQHVCSLHMSCCFCLTPTAWITQFRSRHQHSDHSRVYWFQNHGMPFNIKSVRDFKTLFR